MCNAQHGVVLMTTLSGPRHAVEEFDAADRRLDRRRPGRMTHVSPELIPLLRGQFNAGVVEPPAVATFAPRPRTSRRFAVAAVLLACAGALAWYWMH